jgi:hypothetical protein
VAEVTPVFITGLVEGPLDAAVLERLVAETGATLGHVRAGGGKADVLAHLQRYNRAAARVPWIALVDLDRDAECAAAFRAKYLPAPARYMCFRVVVRAIEAWLLADRGQIAAFLDVPVSKIPSRPEEEADPKRRLVDLARRSRRPEIKEALVPAPNTKSRVGTGYGIQLMQFVHHHWRPEVAARNADSLRRCRERLQALVQGRIV